MIGFFTDHYDVSWCVDDIESLGPEQPKDKNGHKNREIRFKTDRANRLLMAHQVDELMRRAAQLLPCEPGLNLIWSDDCSPPDVVRSRIIAWARCIDGEVRAVTAAGVNASLSIDEHVWVEYPDGRIEAVGEYTDPWCAGSVADLIGG